ncbi:MAG: ABC transporter permease [Bryobacteraceae bacterium]|nr:ABC transporter permease [Bryobacteraceae bacterium]
MREAFRFAARSLRRNPGFASVAILALALGLGATTTVYTLVRTMLFEPIPFHESENLYWLRAWSESRGATWPRFHGRDMLEYRERQRSFESLEAILPVTWNLQGATEARRILAARVTAGFFQALRVKPSRGRLPEPAEHVSGKHQRAVLSHSLWMSEFGGDRRVLGRRIELDSETYEVIGVMPKGFAFPPETLLWAPLPMDTARARPRLFELFGRLKPGVTRRQAEREAEAISAAQEHAYPEDNRGLVARVASMAEEVSGPPRPTLLVFSVAVALVLLIACANVANLAMARAESRTRELAVRAAIGAGRGALAGHIMAENLLLAWAGGLAGFAIANGAAPVLARLSPEAIRLPSGIAADPAIAVFAFAAASLAALLFGLFPAWTASGVNLPEVLRGGWRGATCGRQRHRFRRALIAGEVALACMLLTAAGLLVQSLSRLVAVDRGFRGERVLTMTVVPGGVNYRDDARRVRYFEQLLERIRAVPGVESASAVNAIPLRPFNSVAGFWMESDPERSSASRRQANFRITAPDYLRTMGIALQSGRPLDQRDGADAPAAVMVNREFERRWLPGGAVGRRLVIDAGARKWPVEIVGVYGNVLQTGLAAPPQPEIAAVHTQLTPPGMTLAIRSSRNAQHLASAVRAEMRAIDRRIAAFDVRTMEEVIADSVAQPRLRATLLGVFSSLALALAALGVYGVVSFLAAARTREIGVRVAIGARPGDIAILMIRDSLTPVCVGLAAGLAGALALARFLRGFLFGIDPFDFVSFAAPPVVLLVTAMVASAIPMLRAMRVDPAVTLRTD